MKAPQTPVSAKTFTQTLLTLALAMSVTVFAVVVDMIGTTSSTKVAVGAAAGAAAALGALHVLWETEVGNAAVEVTAVAGSIAGAAAAILPSLVGEQTLTAAAVVGAIAGATIIAVAKTQLQWIIDKTMRGTDNLQKAESTVKGTEANQTLLTSKVSGESESATAAASEGDSAETCGSSKTQDAIVVGLLFCKVCKGILSRGQVVGWGGSHQRGHKRA